MNDLAIRTNEKAHTDSNGMDFLTTIAEYAPATDEQLRQHQTATILTQILPADKLRFISHDIIVNGENKPTAGAIGVILDNPHGQASNMAILPAGNGEPFLLHGFNNDALVIGDSGEFIATDSLDNAIELKVSIGLDDERYTILAPLQQWQFTSMVKAYAKQQQVTLLANYEQGKEYEREFKGDNVKVIATVDMPSDLLREYSLNEIINDPHNDPRLQTKIKVLNGIEWGEPEPLADDTTPATRYPIEAWAGVLRGAVEAIAYHAQVPQAMAGQCVLGALATMLQQYINAPFSDGVEYMPVSLFLLTRGASCDGKNRTVRLSHKAIKNHQKQLDEKYRDDLDVWQADKRATPRKELEQFLYENPQPVAKTLFVSSGTLQGIIHEMLNNQQKSIAWVTSDAGQFFGGYSMDDKNGSKTISDLSDVWSEGYFDNVTKGNLGNKRAYDLRFTLDLQGQDEIIRKPLADPIMNGQGFLPRFLFAFPDSLRGKRVYNTPTRMNDNSEHDPRLQSYWQACNMILDPLPTAIQKDSEGNPVKINMGFADHPARQALADYQQSCENAIGKGGRLEKYPAYAGRQAENASRIACLMAYFEGRTALTVDDIKRATLLTDYSMAERLRYDGESTGGDSDQSDSQRLIDWLTKKAKEKQVTSFNRTYIANNCPNPMRKSSRILQQELDHLESAGYIRQETEGRKKVVFINPCLLV